MTDKVNVTEFDVAEYLNSEEDIAEYLAVSAEDPNPNVFLRALSAVARARGMTLLAQESGLGRESLYKALSPGRKPQYATVMKIMNALGVRFNVCSIPRGGDRKPAVRAKTGRTKRAG